jgi:hypothetical protein
MSIRGPGLCGTACSDAQGQTQRSEVETVGKVTPAFRGRCHHLSRIGFQFERKSEWVKLALQAHLEVREHGIFQDLLKKK